MKLFPVVIGTALMATALVVPTAPTAADASLESATPTPLTALATTELVDVGQFDITLDDAGYELLSVEASGQAIEIEVESELGDGSVLATEAVVDLEERTAMLDIDATTPDVADGTFELEILEFNDAEIRFVITDHATGESRVASTLEGDGAIAIVLGIPIAIALLKALLATAAVIVIAGATYVVASEAIRAIQNRGSSYQHFVAIRRSSGLYIGNGMTYSTAITRARGAADVWSRTQNGARSVCASVRANGRTIGAEIDASGSNRHYHYHPNPRNGAHCFYGGPR